MLVGICCAYQILAIYKASTYVREEVAGLTTAVANMIIMIFGYAFHATIGAVVNAMGGPNNSKALLLRRWRSFPSRSFWAQSDLSAVS